MNLALGWFLAWDELGAGAGWVLGTGWDEMRWGLGTGRQLGTLGDWDEPVAWGMKSGGSGPCRTLGLTQARCWLQQETDCGR
jgi:hypothetical protein